MLQPLSLVAACLLCLSAACATGKAPAGYEGFARLSTNKKARLLRHLFKNMEFGRPEHKPLCRDLLAARGAYAGADATAWTLACLDLAEKEGWTDLSPFIEAIYARPRSLATYEASFRCLRALSGRLVPDDFLAAVRTVEEDAAGDDRNAKARLATATDRLLRETDKELLTAYAFRLALWDGPTPGRVRRLGAALLASLEQVRVRERLRRFQEDFDPARAPDLSRLAAELEH